MTIDDLKCLKFNTPLFSKIDNSIWYFDRFSFKQRVGTAFNVHIFKELVDIQSQDLYETIPVPWTKHGILKIPMSMFMEDFELVDENCDIKFVKKLYYLTQPYSIVKPNYHMIELLF